MPPRPVLVLVLGAAAACGGNGGDEPVDATAPPADADIARTDLVPAVGSDATLDVACWNLRMFPESADAPRVVGDLIASMQLDVVGVEEIDSRAALDAMVARMPGWSAELPTDEGSFTGGIGVVWRTGALTAVDFELELETDPAFPRPVVRVTFDIVGASPPAQLELDLVHLKAGTAPADEQARIDENTALEALIRARVDATDDPIIVLGDFNEDSDDPRSAEVFAPWLALPDHYTVVSKPLDDAGAVTFLPASIMLDQMIVTRALAPAATEAPSIPALDDQLPGYQTMVSDHLPLVVRLSP